MISEYAPTQDPTPALAGARVLVIGDVIADHYIRGTVERTSPEAPVPVVVFQDERIIPGGAANVARNIRAIGGAVSLIGAIGADSEGKQLRDAIATVDLETDGLIADGERPTTVKTRIVSQNQQIVRLDRETSVALASETEDKVLACFRSRLSGTGAVIVSDYGKGVLTPRVLEAVIAGAARASVPVFADPKGRDYTRYRGVTAMTPNAREAADAAGVPVTELSGANAAAGLARAAAAIRRQTGCKVLAITRGAEGLALFVTVSGDTAQNVAPVLLPTFAREVFDVTGAGDTFVAFFALATAAGFEPEQAAHIANAAAGIVVGKSGASVVTPAELRGVLLPDARLARKLRAPGDISKLGVELRAAGRRVVFTNGCFDFLHAGHVALLEQARAQGDVLVLATNSDATIAKLKGAPRPILQQKQRERLLAAIEAVDYVVTFEEETPHALIEKLRPDVLVKGDNYTSAQVEGAEIVRGYGGKVVLLPVLENISTAELLGGKK